MTTAATHIHRAAWVFGGLLGCATVVQEEPPSTRDPSGSVGGNAAIPTGGTGGSGNGLGGSSTGSAGSGNSFGNGGAGRSGNQSGGSSGQSLGGRGGSVGSSGAGGSAIVNPDPQFPTGTVLLEEDFEAFDAAEWIPAPDGGVWAISTDAELQSQVYGQTETNSSSPHLVSSGNVTWTDVSVEADFKVVQFNGSSSSYMAGLCVRVRDAENFYMIGLRSDNGRMQVRNFADGGSNLEQSEVEVGTFGTWFHLRVDVIGSTMTVYVDEVLMLTLTDTTHANGGIGLCTTRASAVFDNVRVTAP